MSRMELENSVETMGNQPVKVPLETLGQPARANVNTGNRVLVAAVLLSQLPLIVLHSWSLWNRPNHVFFPLVVMLVAWLIYRGWPPDRIPLKRSEHTLGMSALLIGLVGFVTGVLLWSPWVGAVGALFSILFLLVELSGGLAASHFACVSLLLWLLIPLPFRLDEEIAWRLQGLSSRSASYWLDFLRIDHVLTGHVIHVPGHRFMIDQACSGSQTLFVMIAFALTYAVVQRYRPLRLVLLLACAIGWAMAGNAFRIVLLVVGRLSWSMDFSTGYGQVGLGFLTLACSILMLLSTNCLLYFLFAPARPGAVELSSEELGETMPVKATVPLMGPQFVRFVSIAYVLIGATQLLPFVHAAGSESSGSTGTSAGKLLVDADSISSLPSDWTFVGFTPASVESGQGGRSATWDFLRDKIPAQLSLDLPFYSWQHSLARYTVQGWEVTERRVVHDGLGPQPATLEVEIEKPTGEFGYLLISLLDAQGHTITPPSAWQQVTAGIVHRLTQRGVQSSEGPLALQLQVFASSSSPLTREQKQRIGELHRAGKEQIAEKLAAE